MDFKPIFDKAKEFVEFYYSTMEEFYGAKFSRRKIDLFHFCDSAYTRNYLAYSPFGQLFTPIGTIHVTPSYDILNTYDNEQLHARLIEKFNLVDIRPGFTYTFNDGRNGNYYHPMYCVPLDPNNPSLELPPPLFGESTLLAYHLRMKVVFREYESTLFNRYIWIRLGNDSGQLTEEQLPLMRDEFNKWQEEVSKTEDDVPFSKGTLKLLQREFLGYF